MDKEVKYPGVSYRPEDSTKRPWRVCVERRGHDRFQKAYATQAEAARAVQRFLRVNHLSPMRRSVHYGNCGNAPLEQDGEVYCLRKEKWIRKKQEM